MQLFFVSQLQKLGKQKPAKWTEKAAKSAQEQAMNRKGLHPTYNLLAERNGCQTSALLGEWKAPWFIPYPTQASHWVHVSQMPGVAASCGPSRQEETAGSDAEGCPHHQTPQPGPPPFPPTYLAAPSPPEPARGRYYLSAPWPGRCWWRSKGARCQPEACRWRLPAGATAPGLGSSTHLEAPTPLPQPWLLLPPQSSFAPLRLPQSRGRAPAAAWGARRQPHKMAAAAAAAAPPRRCSPPSPTSPPRRMWRASPGFKLRARWLAGARASASSDWLLGAEPRWDSLWLSS